MKAIRIAGIDGCKAGWYVTTATAALQDIETFVGSSVEETMGRLGEHSIVGIDMPLGLPESGSRECETLARRLLSPHRHHSVFPVPIRPVLGIRDYRTACDRRQAIDGKRMSVQT
ncbi:MAG: DUF429 domain-containing protein, partial [Deltaproteobacteria bacterium]|nr:DUF429 domain-containing protein [Deltaproteobacteria bacterium]